MSGLMRVSPRRALALNGSNGGLIGGLMRVMCALIGLGGLASPALLTGCKASPVLAAERSAPVGNEFIRLFRDGHAEYGYVVVKENLKARGSYRYANDTVWFLDDSFKAHFPAGYLPIKEGVLYMESGLHFKIKINSLK
jgi:hypothetical protein